MPYNPKIHQRQSIRLPGYDYTQAGCYFVTVCTAQKLPLFGSVVNGEMVLNEMGVIAHDEWQKTAMMRSNIALDVFVVMPNHMHGILFVNDHVGAHCMRPNPTPLGPNPVCSNPMRPNPNSARPNSVRPNPMPLGPKQNNDDVIQGRVQRAPTIGDVVRGYKSAVTKRIQQIKNDRETPIWQRNYYERIVRNERELNGVREYVVNNPMQWELDEIFVL